MVLLNSRVALALLLLPVPAFAAPGGANVTHGSASIVNEGSTTTITNTPGAIINWEQFSVAPDEITRFVQQNAASTVLNRVTGSQGSEILGQLLSNGRVFLINPNGIAIGAGARIDTAGFVASSLGISDADFLSGRERFAGTGQEGRVVNRGSIEAGTGGSVYLIAPNVENDGVIHAPGGDILLAAGHSAELVSSDSPNLRVRISAPAGGAAVNVGDLVAKAGRIGLFGAAVSAGGVLDAGSASRNARGEIVLSASGDTLVEAGARVSAGNIVGSGGSVLVEGSRVAILEGAVIDASGAATDVRAERRCAGAGRWRPRGRLV
jgi:trimeric autotransporter adhesin